MWQTRESTWLRGLYDVFDEQDNRIISHTTKELALLFAKAPKLLEALKPFARLPVGNLLDTTPIYERDGVIITAGDIRRARALITEAKGEEA